MSEKDRIKIITENLKLERATVKKEIRKLELGLIYIESALARKEAKNKVDAVEALERVYDSVSDSISTLEWDLKLLDDRLTDKKKKE